MTDIELAISGALEQAQMDDRLQAKALMLAEAWASLGNQVQTKLFRRTAQYLRGQARRHRKFAQGLKT